MRQQKLRCGVWQQQNGQGFFVSCVLYVMSSLRVSREIVMHGTHVEKSTAYTGTSGFMLRVAPKIDEGDWRTKGRDDEQHRLNRLLLLTFESNQSTCQAPSTRTINNKSEIK
jgi:hypothetical protein